MTPKTTITSCLALALVASSSAAGTKPFSQLSDGAHRTARLDLSEGLRFEGKNRETQPPQLVHLTFRDGKLSNFWFIGHGWEAMHQHGGELRLDEGGITGKLSLRIYDVRGSLQLVADLEFSVGRKDETFDGEFKAKVSGVVDREWTGTAKGSFLKPAEAFDAKANWNSYAGPEGTLAVTDSVALVDNLALARPLWNSESPVPVSYGNAADDRYPNRAAGCRFGGGSSSPVFADGVVYIAFYQPNMDIAPVPKAGYADKWFGKALADYAKSKNLIAAEIEAINDHWRPIADDVIVAMDARTGATLWRTTWPQRSYNLQTHKHRGTFGVPLVAAGKVFYPNLHGRLEVMDAKTGEPLWEFPEFEGPPETKWRPGGPGSQSPLLIGTTLIWQLGDVTYGLDAGNGEVLWENKVERSGPNHSVRAVELGGKQHVLVAAGRDFAHRNVRLIDPGDGSTLWEAPLPALGYHEGLTANMFAVTGDKLVAFKMRLPKPDPENGKIDKSKITHHINAWRISGKGLQHLWEDAALAPDENPHFAIANGLVYGVGKHLVRCLDLETGRQLGDVEETDFPHPEDQLGDVPRSNPLLLVVGDKLLLSPEGQHGKHGFILFDADPEKLTLFGDQTKKWSPPHASTTAYARQPILSPVVDGRVFFRGGNGIYCYDLRK